ncbi:negative regulator of sigma-B (phosphoserine phosphatase) [Pelagirhabdus alkalitolerans]|uniref:Negative regulator of sigma-B (Phosphoserine phosphatase) n=1 Tax=Pelagirhabdus alkalitolerans TaxID=1612202 RepID=A0A1G6JDT3_9BACI|nr:SpoIIE family protein phosphatase [Pelagirhabdus alkalitolerans]SDC16849.1 negative regulator of sigma-B (phosphoserine phosphatase) [Pelagirhabdus alkalitolerans]
MQTPKHVEVSVYQKAKAGNYYCGDSYYYYEDEDFFICALADGLGSGEMAHASSKAVMDTFKENPYMSTKEMVKASNEALVKKRGVVLGVLKLDYRSQRYTYASIGNIGLMMINSDTVKTRNIPVSGYLGGYSRQMKEESEPLKEGTIFALFSDGVVSRDLSHDLFKKSHVDDITDAFKEQMVQKRDDDTTLIVIKY